MELPVKVKLEIPDSNDYHCHLDFPSYQGSALTVGGALFSGVTVKQEPVSPVRIENDEENLSVLDSMPHYSIVESSSSFSNSSSSLSARRKFPPRGVRKRMHRSAQKQLIKKLIDQLGRRSNKTTVGVPTDLYKIAKLLACGDADGYNTLVSFLIGQLHGYCCKRPKSSELNIKHCLLLYLKRPKSYAKVRRHKLLSLPSRITLNRYIGYTTIENEVPSVVLQRLRAEVQRHRFEGKVASLIIEGTAVRVSTRRNHLVGWMDNIFGKVNPKFEDSTEVLPMHLLGFQLQGLSMNYAIPVAFYLMNEPTSSLVHIYVLHVLRCTEKLGIRVVRIQGNDTDHCYNAFISICGGPLKARIPHLLDGSRPLFITFDPSEVIRNVRSCFLSDRRHLVNNGRVITAKPLKDFYLEQKNGSSKCKQFPTRKHLFPSESEKKNLRRAVEILSARAQDTLIMSAQYVEEGEVEATVKFMKFMEKWFLVHDNLFRKLSIDKGGYSDERHSSALADDSIIWVVTKFLDYLETWRNSCQNEMQFLDKETYEALVVTTRATVKFIRHLFDEGLLDILTNHLLTGDAELIKAAVVKIRDNGSLQRIIKTEPDWETFVSSEETILPDVPSSFSDSSSTGVRSRNDLQSSENRATISKCVLSRSLDSYSEDDGDDDIGKKNVRTARKTHSDMSLLKLYLSTVGESREILDIPANELDAHLCQFIWSVRRKDGQEFEPHSLRCLLSSVDRYLASKNYGHAIFRDGQNTKFCKTKDALNKKQNELRKQGRGYRPLRAQSLKGEEIDRLFASGTLSLLSAQALLNTVFFYNNLHFGLKVKEHYQLQWGDVKLLKDAEGREYLEYMRKLTGKGQKRKRRRLVKSRVYCNQENPERDPITAYKTYASRRPPSVLLPDSPFYLSLNSYIYPSGTPWYRPVKMGLHKITQMMQTINQNAGSLLETRFTTQ